MILAMLALASCDSGPDDRAAHEADTRALFRASMALRGHPPTRSELEALIAHPRRLEQLVRDMVDDPGFAATISDMHAEQLKLRWDNNWKPPNIEELADYEKGAIAYSADEPPIKLVEHVVMSGRPYTDIVAGDIAMSNEISSIVYGLPHDPEGPEWQPTWWTDGRPRVGILASSAVMQRYQATEANRMRGRAAWILEELLCEDLSERSGSGIIDPHVAEDAVREDPQCVGCHAVMDPVGSAMYGFYRYVIAHETTAAYENDCEGEHAPRCYPFDFWQPELVADRSRYGAPPPALYGTPASDLEELGQLIAEDPRFAECTARRFWGWMTHQEPLEVDDQLADELVGVLHEHAWDTRELAVAIALHPRFAEGSPDAPPYAIRPGQLDRTIEALTGYAWQADPDAAGCASGGNCWGDVRLATTEKHGMRSLLGGIDGWTVVEPTPGPLATRELGLDWVAGEAADHVVERGSDLLPWGPTVDPSEARLQLAELHLRLFALPVAADSPEVQQAYELLLALHEVTGDARSAWKSVLTALLQDPRLVVL